VHHGETDNPEITTEYFNQSSQRIINFLKDENWIVAKMLFEQLEEELQEVNGMDSFREEYLSYSKSKDFKDAEKKFEKESEKENELIRKYLDSFLETYVIFDDSLAREKLSWWRGEINTLQRWTKNKSRIRSDLAYRMLNLISARSAESGFRYLSQNNYEIALLLNKIWIMASENSVFPYWHMAKIYGAMQDRESTLDYLEMAYEKGMRYKRSLENTSEFSFVREEPRFKELLTKLE
jgi:hypothetical protein